MAKVATEPYKGVRDFYPEEFAVEKYIWKKWVQVAESFGYVEYNASILEPSELYRGKTSEEIVNEQTYTFTDRGDREVTLRPEMTPTVARMIAAKRRELSFPLRWFSIPNVFRYERPQRGRLREHWQLNADIFGVPGIEAEVEIISLAYYIMKAFGAKDNDFTLKIGSRASLNDLARRQNLTEEQFKKLIGLLDRRNKITPAEFHTGISELGFTLDILSLQDPLADVPRICDLLKDKGIKNAIYDPSIVRGFDYYTGTVFEVFDTNPKNNRSLFGGGRYDNLLDLFGEEPAPAVGFGMGDVTIRDFLETRGLLPAYHSSAHLYICHTGNEFISSAQELAQRLRKHGLNVAVDLTTRKVGDQIKLADKQRIPFISVVGEEEIKDNKFKIKHLASGEEQKLVESEIIEFINSR
ncbi:MAG TPA: histidine--tRNA ligase [Candidatus Paceibacterota bacterium]